MLPQQDRLLVRSLGSASVWTHDASCFNLLEASGYRTQAAVGVWGTTRFGNIQVGFEHPIEQVRLAREMGMFETERFIADCEAAFAADSSHKAIREVVARAMSEPATVLKSLGEPKRAGSQTLFHSDSLTILNVIWAPGMMVMPHNHRMWAVIGIYSGREDNVFWRRIPGEPNRIEAAGAKALCEKDTVPLGSDVIHSVINPIDRLTGAIHIYGGGDFFAAERSEWDSLTLDEHRHDRARTLRMFEQANARYEASLRTLDG
ncbi:hypothetical protein [Bradyrhizobium septentrionale]|nr:hypothetical protein [Bradyrhizobium septentrionale]UGY17164.1 hypothetical protein HAP48_0006950 [Bradyrhizobium septentrionale]